MGEENCSKAEVREVTKCKRRLKEYDMEEHKSSVRRRTRRRVNEVGKRNECAREIVTLRKIKRRETECKRMLKENEMHGKENSGKWR